MSTETFKSNGIWLKYSASHGYSGGVNPDIVISPELAG